MSEPGGVASGESPRTLSPVARAIIAAGLVGMLLGFLWGVSDVPRYTATATVLVEGKDGEPPDETQLAAAAEIGASAKAADEAAALLGNDVPGADLLADVDVVPDPDAGAVRVEAEADSPDFAVAAANGFAEALVTVGGKKLSPGAAATLPDGPSENRSAPLWSFLGLLAGLLVGALATVGRARFAGAVPARKRPGHEPVPSSEPEPEHEPQPESILVEDAFGVPILASFGDPEDLVHLDDGVVVLDGQGSGTLAALVDELGLGDDEGPRTLAVIDASAGDGSEPILVGMAISAGELGLRVLLVEGNLGDPSLAARVGVEPSPGLRDYLQGDATPRDVLRSARASDGHERVPLVCVPAGERAEMPDGIGGDRFESLVGRLPRAYDLVLFSAPPVATDGDAATIAGLMDGVVLVSGDDEDAGARIADGVEALADARLLAGVLTRPGVAQARPQSAV